MLNFCIFVFTAFFFHKMFRFIFPKHSVPFGDTVVSQLMCPSAKQTLCKKAKRTSYSKTHVACKKIPAKRKNTPQRKPVQCINLNSYSNKKCA